MSGNNKYEMTTFGMKFENNAGGTPSKKREEYWKNGTISWIGSNMCQNTILYKNDGCYITEEGLNHSSAKLFPVDTVLIALVGATIGKTALLKFETTTNQNVIGIKKIKENGYIPEFVYYYTQFLYPLFYLLGNGGFAMATKSFVDNLPLPIVDEKEQKTFADFALGLDKSKVVLERIKKYLKKCIKEISYYGDTYIF